MVSNGLKPDLQALRSADPDDLYVEALSPYSYMMSVHDAAEFLGQTDQAITQYLREGSLRGIKCGRYWKIPKKLLIEFLYSNLNAPSAQPGENGGGRPC